MTIDDKQMEAALTYLAQTDSLYAEAKMARERSEILRKRVRARIFLTEDGSVAERNAKAEVHEEVSQADGDYVTAIGAFETYAAKRQRAELTIECWRSISANKRKGNIL